MTDFKIKWNTQNYRSPRTGIMTLNNLMFQFDQTALWAFLQNNLELTCICIAYETTSSLPIWLDHPCIYSTFFVSVWFLVMLYKRFDITPEVLEQKIDQYLEQQNETKIAKELINNYNYDSLLDNYLMQQMLLESSKLIMELDFEDLTWVLF